MALRRLRAELLSVGLPRKKHFQQPQCEAEATRHISIIVAISGPTHVIHRCLISIEKYAPHAEVILVDDGTTGTTPKLLKEFQSRKNWKLLRHTCPLGHSRATEAGARIASSPILCFLNSDTVVSPWSWAAIMRTFEADLTIACAGPSTSWAATDQMKKRAMHCRHYWTDSQIYGYAERLVRSARGRQPVELPEVSGFAFFIRRSVWEDLGGFDPNLPDYGNESELCLRILQRGFRMTWVQESYIHHLGRQSYGRLSEPDLLEKWKRARFYVENKYSRPRAVHAQQRQ